MEWLARLHAERNSSCGELGSLQLHAAAGMVAEQFSAELAQVAAALVGIVPGAE